MLGGYNSSCTNLWAAWSTFDGTGNQYIVTNSGRNFHFPMQCLGEKLYI